MRPDTGPVGRDSVPTSARTLWTSGGSESLSEASAGVLHRGCCSQPRGTSILKNIKKIFISFRCMNIFSTGYNINIIVENFRDFQKLFISIFVRWI